MKSIILLNPSANNGKAKYNYSLIQSLIEKNNLDCEIYCTKDKDDLIDVVSSLDSSMVQRVYIVGGDGSLHDCVQKLNPMIELALLPNGTSNDFSKNIYSKPYPLRHQFEMMTQGTYQYIDKGMIDSGKHYFINNVSFGLDALVNHEVLVHYKNTKLPKSLYYPLAAVNQLYKKTSINVSITLDDTTYIQSNALICLVANGGYYGNGFYGAPNAKINDGYLDIVLIDDMPVFKALALLLKYKKGKHLDLPQVHTYKAKKVFITFDQEIIGQYDGETFYTKQLLLEVLPQSIKCVMPKESIC